MMNNVMKNTTNKCSRLRYCSIPSCENVRGTADKNIPFFRVPQKGSTQRKLWIMMLLSTPGVKINIENLHFICHLHFKSEDMEIKFLNGIPYYKLKLDAIPLPIKKPFNEEKVKPVQNITLVDIKEIHKVADTDSRLETLNDCQKTSSNAANSCANCVDITGQLKRAKLLIKKLLQRVNELKRSVQENDCEKCELCRKSLSTNELSEHSCEDGLMAVEFIKFETHDGIMKGITDRVGSIEPLHGRAKTEQPDLSDLSNELYPSTSINVAQNLHLLPNHKFFQCGKCEQSFETGLELKNHIQGHSNVNSTAKPKVKPNCFECFICKKYTRKTEKAMRKHIQRHRLKKHNSKCKICCKRSESTTHLCGNNTDVQCEYCPKRFTTTERLQKHLDNMHKTNRRLHCCDKCLKCYPMLFLKDSHYASHANKPELSCDVCSKIFWSSAALARHRIRHNFQKSFLCEECGKGFASSANLELHKKSHSEPTFQCPACTKKFSYPGDLKRHSNLHNDNTYVCEHCGKELSSMEGYRTHIKLHNRTEADRRFACKQCPMKFFDSNHLKNHEIKHLDIKQFHCQYCEQSYKYRGDYHKHLRTHFVDGKIHECSTCKMRFKYFAEMHKHSLEHYKKNESTNTNQTGESAGEMLNK